MVIKTRFLLKMKDRHPNVRCRSFFKPSNFNSSFISSNKLSNLQFYPSIFPTFNLFHPTILSTFIYFIPQSFQPSISQFQSFQPPNRELPKYTIYHNADCISKRTIKRIGVLAANLPPTGTFQFVGYIATYIGTLPSMITHSFGVLSEAS